ncbi:MAG: TraR/DksA C4-type zinc finger protein, partial [Ascidiaceihabitans sp.]|nr:TraR/DksA C4-type zinc finger protein [Ascidiaceihabitans sp.]
DSLTHCAECEELIPEARRIAIPGVKICIDCAQGRDGAQQARGGINRRGSKECCNQVEMSVFVQSRNVPLGAT